MFFPIDPELEQLKADGKAPEWMTLRGYRTLAGNRSNGYLLPNETPKGLYLRLANTAAKWLKRPDLVTDFYNLLWKGWLGPSSPVMANFGAGRGMPISCFGSYCPDDMEGIIDHDAELSFLTAKGGGVATHLNDIRAIGSPIGSGGKAEGILLPLRKLNGSISSISQNGLRRGSIAAYLDIEHPDAKMFLRMRRVEIDESHRFLGMDHAVIIKDTFVERLKARDPEAIELWSLLLTARMETGEPYVFFETAAQRDNPPAYLRLNLKVNGSNLCSEIMLATDAYHTFVCCLSSLNLAKYDEWKDTNAIELAVYFLDAVMEEFIQKSQGKKYLANALRFAVASRALGLGVMGYTSYLQSKEMPFESPEAFAFNKSFFKDLQEKAEAASHKLGLEYGVPDWCTELGRRNSHLIALAPTVSNAAICGSVSKSIEPLEVNAGFDDGAKGNFAQANPQLRVVLEKYGFDSQLVWSSIAANSGSVQHLKFLSDREREVYKTARELDQMNIVEQAIDRGVFIDQGQSLNLFFLPNTDPTIVHNVHWRALLGGLKALYYLKTANTLKASALNDYNLEEMTPQYHECPVCS